MAGSPDVVLRDIHEFMCASNEWHSYLSGRHLMRQVKQTRRVLVKIRSRGLNKKDKQYDQRHGARRVSKPNVASQAVSRDKLPSYRLQDVPTLSLRYFSLSTAFLPNVSIRFDLPLFTWLPRIGPRTLPSPLYFLAGESS